MTEQERQEGMRPLGRARVLFAVWEQNGVEERARSNRSGIWTPMIRVPGPGRVATLASLEEMVTLNATRVPGQRHSNVVVQRGRGLASLVDLDSYPISGIGRARV